MQLIQGVRDTITWNWTLDDTYSTRSAYRIQFKGSFARFRRDQIWKAHAENKCKVFTWILIHEKLLTADNLQKRDWPHQDHCALCNGPLETGLHLCLCCPFAKAVWNQILKWEHFDGNLGQQQADPLSIIPWWEEATAKVPKTEQRRFNGLVIYTFWNLRKERNRRIFKNKMETVLQVAARIKEDIEQRMRAFM